MTAATRMVERTCSYPAHRWTRVRRARLPEGSISRSTEPVSVGMDLLGHVGDLDVELDAPGDDAHELSPHPRIGLVRRSTPDRGTTAAWGRGRILHGAGDC
jgi:hypothetical protein